MGTKIQHLIKQVFNVFGKPSFFTDFLDFVEKNLYYQNGEWCESLFRILKLYAVIFNKIFPEREQKEVANGHKM